MVGRQVGEQQKNFTSELHMVEQQVGRQQKNQHIRKKERLSERATFLWPKEERKKNYNKEDALKIIVDVAIKYEEILRDNHFFDYIFEK